MSINKFNSEGYIDLTTYEALKRVEKEEKKKAFRPIIYICSPFSGDIKNNIKKARAFCRFAITKNCIPIAPHLLYPQFMDDSIQKDRKMAMHFNYVLLGKCNELWVFGGTISSGMKREIELAKKRRMPIRYWSSECEEVATI